MYLHLHPPVGLWPLLNTWLFGVFSSLKLFGQLPYPTGNTVVSCKEPTATGRFYLQSTTHMYQIPTVSYLSGSGALCSRWMDNCRHMDNSYHRRRCEVTLEDFGERIRAEAQGSKKPGTVVTMWRSWPQGQGDTSSSIKPGPIIAPCFVFISSSYTLIIFLWKKHSPLEKGMANCFSILALRTPWIVRKGKKIRHWKMNSPDL